MIKSLTKSLLLTTLPPLAGLSLAAAAEPAAVHPVTPSTQPAPKVTVSQSNEPLVIPDTTPLAPRLRVNYFSGSTRDGSAPSARIRASMANGSAGLTR